MMNIRWQFATVFCYFAVAIVFFAGAAAAAEALVEETEEEVAILEPGDIIDYQPLTHHRSFFENDLRIYCYRGNQKTLARFFESVELQLEITDEDYTQYEGVTPAEVHEHYNQQRSLFSFSLFSQKRTRLQLSPFTQQCIGIETLQNYYVRLQQVRVDFYRVIQLLVGILLFIYAAQLSHNALFYYITGVLVGICSSFMLLIWLSSKLVPRRTVMYGVLIGGWTVGIYVIQMLWENLQLIVITYRTYVFWYILITGLVSFFFCYRLGPPKNQRSKNIVKWLLQLIALLLIYFSSHFEEASAALLIVTIVVLNFPRRVWHNVRAWYLRHFPPTRRLLTNEEYYEQGVRETIKGLEQLRSFASSPDCKQWRIMSKLSNPMRFAAFVEGASHLRDEEILQFESTRYNEDVVDDSEFSEEGDDEQQQQQQYQQQQRQQRSAQQRKCRSPYVLRRSPHSLHLHRPSASILSHEEMSEEDDDLGNAVDNGNHNIIELATSPRNIANINGRRSVSSFNNVQRQHYIATSGNNRMVHVSPPQQCAPRRTPPPMMATPKRRRRSHSILMRELSSETDG